MEELLQNFHFIRPWWLLALLLPLWGYYKFAKKQKLSSSWKKVCDKRLLEFLLIKTNSTQVRFFSFLVFLGFLSAILALAGPSWHKIEVPSFSPQNPVMLVLNVSSDMLQKDLTPDRLSRAKYKIDDMLKLLKNNQTGLIIFTQEPFLITPITDDYRLISNLLPEISTQIMPLNGERLDRALDLASDKLKNSGYKNGNIVLLSSSAGTRLTSALDAAAKAANSGYPVSVLDISTQPSEQLQLIAESGKGVYTQITSNDSDIHRLIDFIEKQTNFELKESENLRTTWLDYGYYLAFLPLFCGLLLFQRGFLILAFVFLTFSNAQAGFFFTNDQEAQRAFNQGDYASASQKFENTNWKASSFYKNGDYEQAYRFFSQNSDTESLYNQGNALAKSGKIDEAIKKYEDVLKLNPNHEDAKFNLEYLKQQQQQENQQSSDNNNKDEQNQNENQNQQQSESGESSQQEQNSQNQQNDNQPSSQNSQNSSQNNSSPADEEQREDQQQSSSQSQTSQGEKTDNQNERESSSSYQHQPQNSEQQQEMLSASGTPADEDEKDYDEKAQALEQQYREIPEEPGGLLRAYIYKDYLRKRYKD